MKKVRLGMFLSKSGRFTKTKTENSIGKCVVEDENYSYICKLLPVGPQQFEDAKFYVEKCLNRPYPHTRTYNWFVPSRSLLLTAVDNDKDLFIKIRNDYNVHALWTSTENNEYDQKYAEKTTWFLSLLEDFFGGVILGYTHHIRHTLAFTKIKR